MLFEDGEIFGVDEFNALATEILGNLAGLVQAPVLPKAPGNDRLPDIALFDAALAFGGSVCGLDCGSACGGKA